MLREPNPEIIKPAMEEFWTQLKSKKDFKDLNEYDLVLKIQKQTGYTFEEIKKIVSGECPTHGLFLTMLKNLLGINIREGEYCPTVYQNLLKELYECDKWSEFGDYALRNISAKLSEIIGLLKK